MARSVGVRSHQSSRVTVVRRGVQAHAPAKVNLGLRVAARRSDGFHEIETLFTTVGIADTVEVQLATDGVRGVVRDARFGSRNSSEPTPAMGPSNLAWRAADAYLAAAGAGTGVWIALDKRLPVAAGLGGGSSDAAAVLRSLTRLVPSDVDSSSLAARLGSDVPFFASGFAAARGSGRGERLVQLELPSRWLVLVNPGVPVAASDAYRWIADFTAPIDWTAVAQSWAGEEAPRLRNDLQPGVIEHVPEVAEALRVLGDVGLASPLMSGSGASCFALASSEAQARRATTTLRAGYPGWWVVTASAPADEAWRTIRAVPGAAPHE